MAPCQFQKHALIEQFTLLICELGISRSTSLIDFSAAGASPGTCVGAGASGAPTRWPYEAASFSRSATSCGVIGLRSAVAIETTVS
eukprot:7327312-Prymnesium_polylepis.2